MPEPNHQPSQSFDELPEASKDKAPEIEVNTPDVFFDNDSIPKLDYQSEPANPSDDQVGTYEKKPLSVAIVDQSFDAIKFARNAAERRLTEELNDSNRGFTKKIVDKIWKGNLMRHYNVAKYTREAKDSIFEAQNILLHEVEDTEAKSAAQTTIDRYLSEYQEMIHEENGETKNTLDEDSQEYKSIKQSISKFASGDMSKDDLIESTTSIKQKLLDEGHNKDLVSIDNMIEVASQAKYQVDHGESIDRVLDGFSVHFGESRSGVRTEAEYSKVDNILSKIERSKLGSVIGSEYAISAAAAVIGAGTFMARKGASTLARATFIPGLSSVLAGGIAAHREGFTMKQERAQHAREIASGKEFSPEDKRRVQLEAAEYKMISSEEVLDKFSSFKGQLKSGEINSANIDDVIAFLASTEARIGYSDKNNIDLLSFSDPSKIEDERFAIDLARAELKTELNKLGLNNDDVVQRYNNFFESEAEALAGDISEKDQIFDKLRHKRMLKVGAATAATSFAMGLLSQEVVASLSSNHEGLVEQLWDGKNNEGANKTVLFQMFGNESKASSLAQEVYENIELNGGPNGQEIQLSEDIRLVPEADGEYSFMDSNNNILASDIKFSPEGKLSAGSIKLLSDKGIDVQDLSFMNSTSSLESRTFNVQEYIGSNKGDFSKVHHQLWYDNNTPTTYDQNELGLHWGNSVDGGFSMSASTMTADGSFSGQFAANAHELAQNGSLKLAVYASENTQSHAIFIDATVDAAGGVNFNIPPGSVAEQFFARDANGTPQFKGAFAEVVQMMGSENGAENIRTLATEVGDGSIGEVISNVEVPHSEEVVKYAFDIPGKVAEVMDRPIDIVSPIPFSVRKSIGDAIRNPNRRNLSQGEIESAPSYYSGLNQETIQRWIREDPNRLKPRRQVESNGTKYWVESDGSVVERNVARERSTLQGYLEKEFENDPSYKDELNKIASQMGEMSEANKVSINVPAYHEEKNIYRLLEEFSSQQESVVDNNTGNRKLQPVSMSDYEINILVNRKVGTAPDNTVGEIERFKEDYKKKHGLDPKINYFDIELPEDKATVGYARKILTDAVLARSLERSNQQHPLYIESEDADVVKADRFLVSNLIEKFDQNPHLEALKGEDDRDLEIMKENDYLFMRKRAWDFLATQMGQKKMRDPNNPRWSSMWNRVYTNGWNGGYTAEGYANIGGYDDVKVGEDMAIGEKISMIRGDGINPNLEVVGRVRSRSFSSPRRFMHEILSGTAAYDNFGDEEIEQQVRNLTDHEMLDAISDFSRINQGNQEYFTKHLQMTARMAADNSLGDPVQAEHMVRRIMFGLGYKNGDYTYKNGHLDIVNHGNFANSIERYRARFNIRGRGK